MRGFRTNLDCIASYRVLVLKADWPAKVQAESQETWPYFIFPMCIARGNKVWGTRLILNLRDRRNTKERGIQIIAKETGQGSD